jgi:PPOX class probable F420-dependent enzyme
MPKLPLPREAEELLGKANPAVIGTVRADGSPHTAVTWYLWENGRVLVNMAATRVRLRHIKRDPRVSLTVMDSQSWYRQVTVFGNAVEIYDDKDLADIDRLSLRYTRNPYRNREDARVSAWVEVEGWYGWENASAWPASS